MKLLITGANGQLGTELQLQLKNGKSALGEIPPQLKNAEVVTVDIQDVDLSNLEETQAHLARIKPNIVINCAAFTNVDLCETQPDAAFAGNALVARNLAIACEQNLAKLVHVSTDYVFSGNATAPVPETRTPCPQSVYGRTKLLGEEYIKTFCTRWFIVRTAWLYGVKGNNFVKAILKNAKDKGALKVVNDQIGNPTNAEDLAHHLLILAASTQYGIYHCTGEGVCSWYDFASEIVRLSGIKATVSPCTTDEYPRPAKRPAYSALDNVMLRLCVGNNMRPWQQALESYFENRSVDEILQQ